jgi:hypothetical protein
MGWRVGCSELHTDGGGRKKISWTPPPMTSSELQAMSAPTAGVTVACRNGNVRAWSDDFEPTPPGRFLGFFFLELVEMLLSRAHGSGKEMRPQNMTA